MIQVSLFGRFVKVIFMNYSFIMKFSGKFSAGIKNIGTPLFVLIMALIFAAPINALAQTKKFNLKNDDGIFYEGLIFDASAGGKLGVIDLGSADRVSRGETFLVIRRGEKVVNPETGQVIRVKQKIVGKVEIVSVSKTYSDIKVSSSSNGILQHDYVRRVTSSPAGLSVNPIGFRKMEILWSLQAEPETDAYFVYRASSPDGSYERIGKTGDRDKTRYVDENSSSNRLSDNTTYYYKVSAINSLKNESALSPPVAGTTAGAPLPPSGLSAKSGLIRSVDLAWEKHKNDGIAGYKIYRSQSPESGGELIAELKDNNKTEYADYGGGSKASPRLSDKTQYYYSISAFSPYKFEGERSKAVGAVTADKPAAPTNFEALGWQAKKVPLTWDKSEDENVRGYYIYRSENEEGPYEQIAEIKGGEKSAYVDTGRGSGLFGSSKKEGNLANFTLYYYKIQSYNWIKARSDFSPAVPATTKAAPMAPEEVKATTNRPDRIPLAWRKNPEVDLSGYEVFRSESADGKFKKIATLSVSKNYYLDENLGDNKTFYYKLRAVDNNGIEGDFSVVVSATTKPRPGVVKGLKIEMKDGKTYLKWDPSPEIDISLYRVYKKSFFGWEKVGTASDTQFELKKLKRGDKGDFAVSAIDADNMESDRTGIITVDLR